MNIIHPDENDELVLGELNRRIYKKGSCFGNTLADAFKYLFTIGTCTEKCLPYNTSLANEIKYKNLSTFENPEDIPLCSNITGKYGDMCSDFVYDSKLSEDGTPQRFYKAFHYYVIPGIKEQGGDWGPVASGFIVYPDFYDYTGGIYEWNNIGPKISAHAIVIVGWGEEKGKKYWIIRNSWGKKWGEGGYFRMIRGVNHCELEENCVTGVPDFFYPLGYVSPGSFPFSESEKIIEQRTIIASNINIAAGGIDPETGYTRRVMLSKPNLDYRRPVPLNHLPDWNIFVAGIDSSPKGRSLYRASINSQNNYSDYSLSLILSITIILLLVIFILVIYYIVNKFRLKN
jgi:hypothetical protein